MFRVIIIAAIVASTWLLQISCAELVHTSNRQYGAKELQMVPDKDGNFYQINVTERQMQYGKAQNPDYEVIFYVVTRGDPPVRKQIFVGDTSSLANSGFNPAFPTRIIIHGWLGSVTTYTSTIIPQAYLQRGDFNVIFVDWSDAASNLDYYESRRSITQVGQKVGELLEFLFQQGGLDPSSTYMVGHSLGAHVVGLAARSFTSGRIGVIVALDTALPLFSADDDDQLKVSDAEYTLSIHTNGDNLGRFNPLGHASFYPNYGRWQPGCGLELLGFCSHSRSVQFFAESVALEQNNFMSRKCNSFSDIKYRRCSSYNEVALMAGEPINTSFTGIFYLKTNSRKPYGLGTVSTHLIIFDWYHCVP